MPKPSNARKGSAARMAPSPAPSRRRYHRDALGAVLTILGAISVEAATLFAAIVAIRGDRHGPDERFLDRNNLADMLMLVSDDELDRYLVDVGDQITDTIAINVIDPGCRTAMVGNTVNATSGERRPSALDRLIQPPQAAPDSKDPVPVILSHDFVALLDDPLSRASPSSPTPRLDRIGREDIAMAEAVLRSGVSGHLAVRRRSLAPREVGDLAAILATDDQPVLLYEGLGKGCAAAILRAELHAGAYPPLVLVERDLLTNKQPPAEDSWDEVGVSEPDEASITSFAQVGLQRLVGTAGSISGASRKTILSRRRRFRGSAPASAPFTLTWHGCETPSPTSSASSTTSEGRPRSPLSHGARKTLGTRAPWQRWHGRSPR